MKLQYLGTAAAEGIPAIFCSCDICTRARRLGGKNIRTRAQALVDDRILLDFGPDSYMHALQYGLDMGSIHHCLVTYVHGDHFYPRELHHRRQPFAWLGEDAPLMTVYGPAEVERELRTDKQGDVLAEGRVRFQLLTPFESVMIEGYEVLPLPAVHGTERPLVYAIRHAGKTLLYAHDTGIFEQETWDYLQENGYHFDFVSMDCTEGVRPIDYPNHMNFVRDHQMREKMLAVGLADEHTRFCASHFSHNGLVNYEDALDVAVSGGLEIAYDGMIAEF